MKAKVNKQMLENKENREVDNLLKCCVDTIMNDIDYYENNGSAQKLLKHIEEYAENNELTPSEIDTIINKSNDLTIFSYLLKTNLITKEQYYTIKEKIKKIK